MPSPITAALVGAGERGFHAYSPYALAYPNELKFVAVAEPDPVRRRRFARAHNIPPERQFITWEDLLAQEQLAEVLFNMTLDRMHYPSTIPALEAGYHVLLEKPMAPSLAHCLELIQTAEKTAKILHVCHILRHTLFFKTLHEVLASGQIGDIISVEHRENIIYWHMAHNYVRGNWSNTATASPMILAKCCHDLDILQWNMNSQVRYLQSFGSLTHFRPEHAPPGATRRCTDGCSVEDCLYDARRIYLNLNNTGWPATAISEDLSMAGRQKAIETGPYGQCVYYSHNDVVDHQVVNMEFEEGESIVLVMQGHSYEEERTMRYDGTRATLRGKFGPEGSSLEIHGHLTNRWEVIDIPPSVGGHGGGDFGVVQAFIQAVRGETKALNLAREALEGHLMAFAAEESRLNNQVIDMNDFRQRIDLVHR